MAINLVVYQPEIPQNTGNMMRTCAASNTRLHLIEPFGFIIDDKHIKRAGMDYVNLLDLHTYPSWEAFMQANPNGEYYFLTRYGHRPPSAFDYSDPSKEYYFVVGKESTGIDKEILRNHLDNCMRLPMTPEARSLNVSNCAAIIIYEALRQQNYSSLAYDEVLKGSDFLEGGE